MGPVRGYAKTHSLVSSAPMQSQTSPLCLTAIHRQRPRLNRADRQMASDADPLGTTEGPPQTKGPLDTSSPAQDRVGRELSHLRRR